MSPLPRRRREDLLRKRQCLGATLREVERRIDGAGRSELVVLDIGRDAIREEMGRLGRALG